MEKLTVNLGQRSYEIHIASRILLDLQNYLAPHIKGSKVIIVTDNNVAENWLFYVEEALTKLHKNCHVITVAAGEKSKTFPCFQQCCEEALYWGVDRHTTLIALGGGVVGDLAGFMAASLLRGIAFIQIPTTLLAQVDSSVGGKTGINAGPGKNLIGAFWQPQLVLADTYSLSSLPDRQLKSGYAEVIKYGLIHKPEFFEWLQNNNAALLAKDENALQKAIYESCLSKAQIVSSDEREQGERALLNLGHTFGHVLEAFTGYSDKLFHGEAVAIGMQMAFDYSVSLGICPAQDAETLRNFLQKTGLAYDIKNIAESHNWSAAQFLELMGKDKKAKNGEITLVLVKSIGQAYVDNQVDSQNLYQFLQGQLEQNS